MAEGHTNTGQGPSSLPEHQHYHDRRVYNYGTVGNLATGDHHSGNMETTLPAHQYLERQHQETSEELEEWTRGMVETSAYMKVMEKLNQGKTWVTIKGSPGEGKTTVAKMALRELQKSGRQVFHVRTPEDFDEVTKACPRPVIMLDDVLGDLEFDNSAWLKWKPVFHKLLDKKEHLSHEHGGNESDNERITVLLIGRDYVLTSASVHMGRLYEIVTQDSQIVDMSHSVMRSLDEKQRIWDAIVRPSEICVPKESINSVFNLEGGHGFPHVCRLFVTTFRDNPDLQAEEFFKKPLTFLNETVKVFLKNKDTLTLFKEMIKRQGKVSERELEIVGSEVKHQAQELVGSYLRRIGGNFEFDHPSIYDSVAFNLCRDHTIFVIENCSLPFIHERLQLDTQYRSVNRKTDLVVYISQSYTDDLAKRFAIEILNRNLLLTLSHQASTQIVFIQKMMSQISVPVTQLMNLTDEEIIKKTRYEDPPENGTLLSLLASNKSPNLLMYIENKPEIQLSQSDINTVMYGACKYAALEVMKYLSVKHDPLDINVKYGHRGKVPLMIAAETKDSELVDFILSLNPDLNGSCWRNTTALHILCENGLLSGVRQIIDRGMDVNLRCDHSPLYSACNGQHVEVCKLLLDRGANIDEEVLMLAYVHQNMDIVMMLYDSGRVSDSVIMKAATVYGNKAISMALFKRGASANMDVLLALSCSSDLELVKYMFDMGGSVNTDEGCMSPLHRASDSKNPEVVKFLLDQGAAVNRRDEFGNTSLHLCVASFVSVLLSSDASFLRRGVIRVKWTARSIDCLLMLLKAGANVNAQNRNGDTPLYLSAGSTEYSNILLNAGAEVNIQNKYGYTPLHNAVGSEECVDVLVKAGADVNVQCKDGQTPLHIAVHTKDVRKRIPHIHVCQILIQHEADVTRQDTEGNTPLHLICSVEDNTKNWRYILQARDLFPSCFEDKYRPLVKLLVDHGADINVHNKKGEPALRGWCRTLLMPNISEQDDRKSHNQSQCIIF